MSSARISFIVKAAAAVIVLSVFAGQLEVLAQFTPVGEGIIEMRSNQENLEDAEQTSESEDTTPAEESNAALPQDQGLVPCGIEPGDECGFADLVEMANRIAEFLIMLGLAVSAIAFAWAGFLYMTAAGDPGKINKAHGIFVKVGIGLIIMLSAWLIVVTIERTLLTDEQKGGSLLDSN